MEVNIEELKKIHGPIRTVIIPLDDDDPSLVATFYCKKPDRTIRKMINKLSNSEVPERAVMAGYKALWVAGDDVSILEKHDDGFTSAEDALIRLMQLQKAEIKKN
jgi:hypothetical protein